MIASSAMPVSARGPIPRASDTGLRAELLGFTLLLVLLNLPLFAGGSTAALAFQADAVAAGEWWRLLTHPFLHVSWYHLVLDGTAFLVLYANLHAEQRWRRLTYVAASAAGSLVIALCASPLIATHGLCGLSGGAHGLMAVTALEMLVLPRADRFTRIAGIASFVAVTAKCLFELATGHAFFATLHFGLLGTPIVACHAGGILGGLVAMMLLTLRPKGEPAEILATRRGIEGCVPRRGRARREVTSLAPRSRIQKANLASRLSGFVPVELHAVGGVECELPTGEALHEMQAHVDAG